MRWHYRKRTGWKFGTLVYGVERRDYRFSFSIPIWFPAAWRERKEELAPALKIDPEAFERRMRGLR